MSSNSSNAFDRYLRLEELRETNRAKELDLILSLKTQAQTPDTGLDLFEREEAEAPETGLSRNGHMSEIHVEPTAPYWPKAKDKSMEKDSGLSTMDILTNISMDVATTHCEATDREDQDYSELRIKPGHSQRHDLGLNILGIWEFFPQLCAQFGAEYLNYLQE